MAIYNEQPQVSDITIDGNATYDMETDGLSSGTITILNIPSAGVKSIDFVTLAGSPNKAVWETTGTFYADIKINSWAGGIKSLAGRLRALRVSSTGTVRVRGSWGLNTLLGTTGSLVTLASPNGSWAAFTDPTDRLAVEIEFSHVEFTDQNLTLDVGPSYQVETPVTDATAGGSGIGGRRRILST